MTSREIRAAMIIADVTATDIARTLSVSREMVSQVIHRRRRTPRVREAIAAAIRRKPEEVFDDYVTPKKAVNG